MKKIILGGVAAIVIAVLVAISVNLYSQPLSFTTNVNALVDGNTVDCYSSSSEKKGATYYDCGQCTRQFNSKGVGSTRTCATQN
ncbi:MAG: hypothetical protein LBL90_10630 [Prevotellaceae bacterium]|jgi:hypothetical protein|nr:hypothetical protein [Prevotellaceae bacterium]